MILRAGMIALLLAAAVVHADTAKIVNFRQYSGTFASAGQPTEQQLGQLAKEGYQRIFYLAFSDHKNSLVGEDRIVKSLGMTYLHLPVDWDAPRRSDFELYAAAMQLAPEQRTLLHCQVNFRASAFAMLYRVLYEEVPLATAKADMNSVWTPDATWTRFILETLKARGIASDCDGCDWTPATY